VHLPQSIEAEWVKQLVAEQIRTVKDRRGFARQEWAKLRERNEALDCAVLARAALWLLGADRYGERFWVQLREQVANAPLQASFPPAGMSLSRRRPRLRPTTLARGAGSRRAAAGFAEGKTSMDPIVLAWALAQPAGSRAAALAAAYTGGTTRMTFDGRTVEYRSLDELGRALAVLRGADRGRPDAAARRPAGRAVHRARHPAKDRRGQEPATAAAPPGRVTPAGCRARRPAAPPPRARRSAAPPAPPACRGSG
jgi:hypothetical protein